LLIKNDKVNEVVINLERLNQSFKNKTVRNLSVIGEFIRWSFWATDLSSIGREIRIAHNPRYWYYD